MDLKNHPDITILCKVVDNYGDIGFVYRLARSLSAADSQIKIRLIVSNLASFAKMAPEIDASQPVQTCYGWTIYDWNADTVCTKAFTQQQPDVLLECFQCGRPEWLETLLFSTGVARTVACINIDYLTAESYAEDFHRLRSATRSVKVKKVNFMPGFTSRTGGLILENEQCPSDGGPFQPATEHIFSVALFSYEQDFTPITGALAQFQKEQQETDSKFQVHVNVAEGKSAVPFLKAWKAAKTPFPITQLPFLPQTGWDALIQRSSFNFVRGEDSLSRACLSGIPFIWHAYPQDENYQLVKVQALLSQIEPFLSTPDFELLFRIWTTYNTPEQRASNSQMLQNDLCSLLHRTTTMRTAFTRFASSLISNGNFTDHLLTFITRDLHDFC